MRNQAALSAVALRRHLQAGTGPELSRIMRELSKVADLPWAMAAGANLAFPGAEGRRTLQSRLLGRYVQRLHAAAARDASVGRAVARVTGLVDRPEALLRPAVVGRVLLAALRRPATSDRRCRVYFRLPGVCSLRVARSGGHPG